MVEEAPQKKFGWGDGDSNVNSAIGMQKKSNAAAYWDNKTTELIIPEVEADDYQDAEVVVSAPQSVKTDMVSLTELNKDIERNVPSIVDENIDISLLTCNIRPIVDLIEADMHWDYQSLQAEIGQNFRERYGKDGGAAIEGTKANNM